MLGSNLTNNEEIRKKERFMTPVVEEKLFEDIDYWYMLLNTIQ